MVICVFDTETTGLDKPYCYNIGYRIIDTNTRSVLIEREYVVEQIWHNLALFNTAYYSNKRDIYVKAMRSRKISLEKFGYITQQMHRDFKTFGVIRAFAYNSSFDEKVFNFNCDWFKVINPFDSVPIVDIRGFVHNFLITDKYKNECDKYGYYTETGNYSTTAETVYRIVTNNHDFIEEHTALSDSIIETDILLNCLDLGADINSDYTVSRSIKRMTAKPFVVKKDGQIVFSTECVTVRCNKAKTEINLK